MTTSSKRKLRILILLILGSFLVAHLCFLMLPNVFEILNARAIDQLFILRSSWTKFQPSYDNTVVHLDLNNTSIQRLNDQYLNRSHYAQVVRNLSSMRVSAQVFDFIFASRKSEENDRVLIDAVKEADKVYFGLALELREDTQRLPTQPKYPENSSYLDATKWDVALEGDSGTLYVGDNPLITFPDLAAASRGLGSLSVKFDRDGVLRRVPLLVRYKDAYYPLLPFRVICNYLDVPPEKILLKPGKHIILSGAKKPGDATSHDIEIPIDEKGNMIINYVGSWERMDHYNFADVYLASDDRDELEMWGEELEGKIVIVSDVSTGSTDVGPVPTDANFPLSGAHANIIHGILTESFLREVSGWEMFLVEVMLVMVLLALSLRYSAVYFSFGTVLVIAAFIGTAGVGFFHYNVIFHVGRPLLLILFAVTSINVYRYINEEKEKMESLRQRDFIRGTFGRYMSDEVVEELLGSPEGLSMRGENREVTFLVSDLRGFTALTEKLIPNEVIEIMNRYFEHMVEVIARYRGTVSEFMGDGILAFFGAPLHADDDPARAVACAIEMQNTLVAVNAKQRKLNLPELAMGIGINTGKVVVGNIGSEKRAKYGVVGMPINVAFRIESFTVGAQILISPTTFRKVSSLVRIRGTKGVTFKGIEKPMCLYNVYGINGSFKVSLLETKLTPLTELDPPFPIDCFTVDGKTVSDEGITGKITHIGDSIAEVLLPHKVEAHTNLRILHSGRKSSRFSALYAKVLSKEEHPAKSSDESVLIKFTTLPHEIEKFF
ncbi:MAG: adenylate/guanylate cyclase domain-containing protein, partial [Deltaproteobacteria bacterium]|nr:adenylate/guanylate cyclase domain-containing protein [Deltaproteobacteria bacterium]